MNQGLYMFLNLKINCQYYNIMSVCIIHYNIIHLFHNLQKSISSVAFSISDVSNFLIV